MLKTGEMFALMTAVCWSITALCFEAAGKKVGTLALNLIRLVIAFIFIAVYGLFVNGSPVPWGLSFHTWKWLVFSGIIGFVLGDLFLFKGFINVGARISMLMMSLTPVFAAIIGFFFLKETLGLIQLAGMAVTVSGIAIVVVGHGKAIPAGHNYKKSIIGVACAVLGALGQAGGLVLGKYGVKGIDPFIATQIRIIAGIAGFAIIIILTGKSRIVINALKDKTAFIFIIAGSFFGPFLGVSLALASVKYTSTGVSSTITSIVPVILILPAVFLFHEKIKISEIIGAVISIFGVWMLFI